MRITPITTKVGIGSVSAFGFRHFRDMSNAAVEVSEAEARLGVRPLSQIVISTKRWVYLAAQVRNPETGRMEYATGVHLWISGRKSSESDKFVPIFPARYVPVELTPGIYSDRYEFAEYGRNPTQFRPPEDFEGKGVIAVPSTTSVTEAEPATPVAVGEN
jgi:hypothetical protein